MFITNKQKVEYELNSKNILYKTTKQKETTMMGRTFLWFQEPSSKNKYRLMRQVRKHQKLWQLIQKKSSSLKSIHQNLKFIETFLK